MLIENLCFIFDRINESNWVQRQSIVRLFDKLDVDICSLIISDYHKKVISILFDFSLSPQDDLSDESIKALSKDTVIWFSISSNFELLNFCFKLF